NRRASAKLAGLPGSERGANSNGRVWPRRSPDIAAAGGFGAAYRRRLFAAVPKAAAFVLGIRPLHSPWIFRVVSGPAAMAFRDWAWRHFWRFCCRPDRKALAGTTTALFVAGVGAVFSCGWRLVRVARLRPQGTRFGDCISGTGARPRQHAAVSRVLYAAAGG